MLRNTLVRRIVPQHHPFVPGGRPSERGMLYRQSNVNMHCRIGPIQQSQRTWMEGKQYSILALPDQIMWGVAATIIGLITTFVFYKTQPFSFNRHKSRWVQGGLNQHEMYQRNHEMTAIMYKHKDEVDGTRKRSGGRPDVFSPPADSPLPWKQSA